MCPRSSDPFFYSNLLYEMGHYFLDIQYIQAEIPSGWQRCDGAEIKSGSRIIFINMFFFVLCTHKNLDDLCALRKDRFS